MKLLKTIQMTQTGWGVALLRVILGIIFIREGSGKLLGWFGGVGPAATGAFFAQLGIPFPQFNAYLVGLTEFLGGLAFLAGFLTRLAVIPIVVTMMGAIMTAKEASSWNHPLLIIAASLSLLQAGAGPLSLDRRLSKDRRSE